MARLRRREHARFGKRILPGGDMYELSQVLLAWAASYDEGELDIRSRLLHEQWLLIAWAPSPCQWRYRHGHGISSCTNA
jgi:hypothetical protein